MTPPEGWKLTALGSVLERVVLPVTVEPAREYRQIGIRSHGKGIFHKPAVTGEALGEKRVFWVVPDALVMNIIFAWEQAVAVTSAQETGMVGSHRFPMYRAIGTTCDVRFLLQFFKTRRGRELLDIASPGGAGRNKTLGQKSFENLRVPMPSGKEQSRIATLLETWDSAISNAHELIKISSRHKQAIIEEFFSGKPRGADTRKTWKPVRLGDIAKVIVSSVDKKSYSFEKKVRLCNYTDVYYNDFICADVKFMSATASLEEIEKFSIFKGDVLITKDSESAEDIAVSACIQEQISDLLCGYHLAIVRPIEEKIEGSFLQGLFSLLSSRAYFRTHANGVTRFGLPLKVIEDASFLIPNRQEQKRLANIFRIASMEVTIQQKRLRLLNEERRFIAEALLTGKRRLPQYKPDEVEVSAP
jgi:type I restriction enzyme S subunit